MTKEFGKMQKHPGNCEKCNKYSDDLYDCDGHYFCNECGGEIDMLIGQTIERFLGLRK